MHMSCNYSEGKPWSLSMTLNTGHNLIHPVCSTEEKRNIENGLLRKLKNRLIALKCTIRKGHFATLPWIERFKTIARWRKAFPIFRYEDKRHTSESPASNLDRIYGHTPSFVQHPSSAKDTPDMFDCLIPCPQIRNRSHQTMLADFLPRRRCYEHRKRQRNRAHCLRQIPLRHFRENDWRRERRHCA